jgi:hypothetical protein
MVTRVSSRGKCSHIVKLTAYLHQVSKLRLSGAVRLSVPSICRHGVHRYDFFFGIFNLPIIQGDSEGTVNISGGDNIRQWAKNSSYGHGNRHRAVWISGPNSVRFLFLGFYGEQSVQSKVDTPDEFLVRILVAATCINKCED